MLNLRAQAARVAAHPDVLHARIRIAVAWAYRLASPAERARLDAERAAMQAECDRDPDAYVARMMAEVRAWLAAGGHP